MHSRHMLTCVVAADCQADNDGVLRNAGAVWQGKQILQDGIGRATEIEEDLPAVDARRFLQQPSELLKLPSELMQNLARWEWCALSLCLTASFFPSMVDAPRPGCFWYPHKQSPAAGCHLPGQRMCDCPAAPQQHDTSSMQPCSSLAVRWHALLVLLCSKYDLGELVCLGGFDNTRQELSWQGFTLELDETKYPWGTLYELEAETVSMNQLYHQA